MATKKHDNLASALAAAQGEMSNASKNAKNPHFKSTYADLATMRDAVIPVLSAHGIACVQLCEGDGSSVSITTRFMFGDEVMDCGKLTIPIGGARNPAQAAGAAVTYGRRFSLGTACNLAAEDDDGNSLDGTRPVPVQRRKPSAAAKVRHILKHEIGCESATDAEAALRYATEGKFGAAEIDTEGDELLEVLEGFRDTCGGDWTGYLNSAVKTWEAQA